MQVRHAVLRAVIAHAQQAAPEECCGLLLGSREVIDESCAARNLRESPSRFLIDPADHFQAIRRARATGRAVCGAYHSHPRGPSDPSETDAAEVNDRSLLHMIVSLRDEQPSVRLFEWTERNFAAVDLVPVP